MKTVFYLNRKKITRKNLNELLGKAVVRELVFRTKEMNFINKLFMNNLIEDKSFQLGSYGIVTVCFV